MIELLILLAVLFAGIIMLAKGADSLVTGSSNLALSYGISLLVISLLIVSLGTSLPELFVSSLSSAQGQEGIALGNVLGSNIANILLVLGVAAVLKPIKMEDPLADRQMMILGAVSFLILVFVILGGFTAVVGLAFLVIYGLYAVSLLRTAGKERRLKAELESEAIQEIENLGVKKERPLISWIKVILGFAGVLIGSEALIYSAVGLADMFGISPGIIALSVVAFGTSLPELATCVVAALKSEDSISLGTIIGSNNFNALVVLGTAALISPIGIGEGMWSASLFMILAFAVLLSFFFHKKIPRWGGALMIALYAVYILTEYGV